MKEPVYCLNSKILYNNYCKYSKYFSVYYPVKSNNNPKLLMLLNKYGSYFEVESAFHLQQLISLGISPQKILFYSPLSIPDDLNMAAKLGVGNFVVSNLGAVSVLEAINFSYNYLIRLREDRVSTSRKKFGFSIDEIDLIEKNVCHGVCVGVAFYLNAEVNTVDNLKKMIDFSSSFLISNEIKSASINIGGGIHSDSCQEIARHIENLGDFKIIVEPGKDLVNPAVDLIATVMHIDPKRNVAYLNVGIYNGLLDVVVKNRKFDIQVQDSGSSKRVKYLLSGPTADNSDILGEYELPELKVGDNIIFYACGAYSEVFMTPFYGLNFSKTNIE